MRPPSTYIGEFGRNIQSFAELVKYKEETLKKTGSRFAIGILGLSELFEEKIGRHSIQNHLTNGDTLSLKATNQLRQPHQAPTLIISNALETLSKSSLNRHPIIIDRATELVKSFISPQDRDTFLNSLIYIDIPPYSYRTNDEGLGEILISRSFLPRELFTKVDDLLHVAKDNFRIGKQDTVHRESAAIERLLDGLHYKVKRIPYVKDTESIVLPSQMEHQNAPLIDGHFVSINVGLLTAIHNSILFTYKNRLRILRDVTEFLCSKNHTRPQIGFELVLPLSDQIVFEKALSLMVAFSPFDKHSEIFSYKAAEKTIEVIAAVISNSLLAELGRQKSTPEEIRTEIKNYI